MQDLKDERNILRLFRCMVLAHDEFDAHCFCKVIDTAGARASLNLHCVRSSFSHCWLDASTKTALHASLYPEKCDVGRK